MVRNRLNLRIDTWPFTRLIYRASMVRVPVALSGGWPVPSHPTAISISSRHICRWWLSRLALIPKVFWIWVYEKLKILLVINLLIGASTTRIRRIIDVMIIAHVGCRWLLSHTWPRDMMLRVRGSWSGSIRAQIESTCSCVSRSNLNSSSINVHHTTPASSLMRGRGSEWVRGRSQHHQIITLSLVSWGRYSCLGAVVSLSEGRLVVVWFFIKGIISCTILEPMCIILWRHWIILMHLLLSCQRWTILRVLQDLMTICHIMLLILLLILGATTSIVVICVLISISAASSSTLMAVKRITFWIHIEYL
jgi:hypothetical protein